MSQAWLVIKVLASFNGNYIYMLFLGYTTFIHLPYIENFGEQSSFHIHSSVTVYEFLKEFNLVMMFYFLSISTYDAGGINLYSFQNDMYAYTTCNWDDRSLSFVKHLLSKY